MERREGLLEFRINQIETVIQQPKLFYFIKRKPISVKKNVLEYRQCYKGVWSQWKIVDLPQDKDLN